MNAVPLGAVATPMIVIVATAVLTLLLPAVSPRGHEIEPFVSVYVLVMLAVQVFVLIAALALLMNAAGHPVQMPLICMLGIGAPLVLIGNYMGKLRKNFFFGIRATWALASDAVCERTHRMGGRLFMLAGVTIVAMGRSADVVAIHCSRRWVDSGGVFICGVSTLGTASLRRMSTSSALVWTVGSGSAADAVVAAEVAASHRDEGLANAEGHFLRP